MNDVQEAPRMNRDALRSAIFDTNDIVIEPVATPEWPKVDGQLYVRTLSGTDRERYIESIRKTVGTGKKQTVEIVLEQSSAKLVALTLCDKDGVLLFKSGDPHQNAQDVIALGKKSSKALERITTAASNLNGLGDDDEATKNASAETTGSASSTD